MGALSNLSRAMSILEALADEPAGVRVTDLAVQMKVNRAIPHRLLTELCELGYVVQDPDSERYRAPHQTGLARRPRRLKGCAEQNGGIESHGHP